MVFNFGITNGLSKESTEFKPVKQRLKIDLVSHPERAEKLGNYKYQE